MKRSATRSSVSPADIEKNLLSVLSPLGRALISKEEGDDLEFRAPGGLRHFSIISVEYI